MIIYLHFPRSGTKITSAPSVARNQVADIRLLQVIDFQNTYLTKQIYSIEACMFQLGYLIRKEF